MITRECKPPLRSLSLMLLALSLEACPKPFERIESLCPALRFRAKLGS